MMKGLLLNADLCTGCLQCEMACSLDNEGMFNPARSRIKIFEVGHGVRAIPYTCTQCDEAWCMKACPTTAISVGSDGFVKLVDEALCVGCRVCTNACPYGTINYHPETGKVHKCDLCGGDPECAKACPTGAIDFGELQERAA
ncbi:4Fe-4S dicluster domain-containing protein [Gammaproteobacteria bacterium]|nr:4Fe-4S dicluster domain-containing protein [Gammaproteobacteria bacterium]